MQGHCFFLILNFLSFFIFFYLGVVSFFKTSIKKPPNIDAAKVIKAKIKRNIKQPRPNLHFLTF